MRLERLGTDCTYRVLDSDEPAGGWTIAPPLEPGDG